MFPQQVKERLLAEKAEQVAMAEQQRQLARKSPADLDLLELAGIFTDRNGAGGMDKDDFDDDEGIAKSKPLADLYPECTILFADIVGFVSFRTRKVYLGT